MKIFVAELVMISEDEDYEVKFNFEENDKDFEFNENKNEFIHFDDWSDEKFPAKMSVKCSTFTGLKVVQAFDRELDKEELQALEQDMRYALINKLETEKQKVVLEFDQKINKLKIK